MRVQNHIPIKAVAIREEDGLEIGTEYDVEDIMMGQSNTSVELVGTKGTYNSISFKFMLNGREIDIFRSPLINPYMKFDGNNGICGDSGYACKRYQIIGNANNLSDHECAIIADGGNLCFGYRMEGQEIVVYTD